MKSPVRFVGDMAVNLALRAECVNAGVRRQERSSGGLDWVYLDSGGEGAPLVMIHGFGADKYHWTRVASHMRGHFRIIVPDLPGFGESEAPASLRYRIQDHVERLRGFLLDLGVTHPHIGGNSMGGYIAGLYAATYPAEVASLWLVNSAGVFNAEPSEMLRTVDAGLPNPLLPQNEKDFKAVIQYAMSKPPHFPEFVMDVMARRALAARTLRASQFKDVLEESHRLDDRLAGLPVPTHILWGEKDRLIHVDCVRALRELLPNSTSTVLKGIGHIPMLEDPEESARDYLAFRERLMVAELSRAA